jgi:Flp pilus assembly protein TadD
VEAFSRAAQLQPTNPRAHLNLGQSLALAGQVEEAAAELRRARQLSDPGSAVERLAEEALRRLTGSSPSG